MSVYISLDLRSFVAERSGGRCSYCLSPEFITGTPLDVDHIIPTALGGPTHEKNLCAACSRCNAHKGDRIAVTAKNKPIPATRTA